MKKSARYVRPSHTPQTHLSDFCELAVVSRFNTLTAQEQRVYDAKYNQLTWQERGEQIDRAIAMSHRISQHLDVLYPFSVVNRVRWCGRRAALQKLLPHATPKHPADILVTLNNGVHIGVSLKSTGKSRDCAYRHCGVKTLDTSLGVSFATDLLSAYAYQKLPAQTGKRKQYLRAHPTFRQNTLKDGEEVLARLTGKYFTHLQKKHRSHQLRTWLLDTFTARGSYPPFLIVTGRTQGEDTYASLLDPLHDSTPLIKRLSDTTRRLTLTRLGHHSIGIGVGGIKTMILRFKWESEPMASALKVSAEPWV